MDLREKIASRIIVDCGHGGDSPCPHAYPFLGYEKCPHEDKDICLWQLEQADEILKIIHEEFATHCTKQEVREWFMGILSKILQVMSVSLLRDATIAECLLVDNMRVIVRVGI